jgi:integrase
LLKTNPAAEIEEKPKVPKRAKKDRRKGLTPAELRDILPALEQEFEPHSDIVWWVHALVYSGARPEEIGQLDRANVRQEQGAWVLDINEEDGRKTKNDNSVRTVPVHPRLIERGFIAFATKGKGARVFSSFEKDTKGYYGGNEARRFIRFLRGRMGIKDSRKVLYSTRHAFHTAMRNAGVPYDIQLALVGRLDEENVDHGDYGDTPLAAKVRWIGKIDPLAD